MDTADVFVKTAKGMEEIEKRTHHLGFRHRTALIQVDGHNAVEVLLPKIPGDGFVLLEALLKDGFIARADGRLTSVTSAPNPSSAPAIATAGVDLEAAKRRAAKSIESLLGPDGDAFAVAIERTLTVSEFAVRAARTRGIVEQMLGATRAKEFWDATGL